MNDRDPHWLDKTIELLTADTADLRKLAKIAGRPAKTFYRGVNLAGADLRGQRLKGMDFTQANLQNVQIDRHTRIDPQFLVEALGTRSDIRGDIQEITDDISISNSPALKSQQLEDDFEFADAETVVALAKEMQKRGAHEQASVFLAQHTNQFISNIDFVFALGQLFEDSKSTFAALTLYRHALDANPDNRRLLLRTANLAIRHRQLDYAEQIAQRLLEADKDDIDANLLFAEVMSRRGRFKDAMALYGELIHRMPNTGRSWSQLGRVLLARANSEEALHLLSGANERRPDNCEILKLLLHVASAANRSDIIEDALRRSTNGVISDKIIRAIGISMRVSLASKKVRQALVQTGVWKKHPRLLMLVADHIPREDIDTALEIAASAVNKPSGIERVFALLLISKGPKFSSFDKLKALSEGAPDITKGIVKKLAASDRLDDAVSIARLAIERHPDAAGPRKWLIETLTEAGAYDLALAEWRAIKNRDMNFGKATMRMIEELHEHERNARKDDPP